MKAVKLKELKQGEWFTRKPNEYPTEKQVFIREHYIREDKKYCCTRWCDIGDCIELKGDTIVYIDFTF